MTTSPPASSDGTEVIEGILESSPSAETTPEETTKELYLDLAPLAALANKQKVTVPRSPNFSRKDVVQSFQSAFELIGGVPRLALWADKNTTEFYKLYSRLLPSQASSALGESNTLRLEMAVAPGPLDQE